MALRAGVQAEPHDPIMETFDKGVALTAYGLLFISPFLLGPPALAGLGMAFAHRNDPHSLMRSHYRFQIRIFWISTVCLVIAIALALGAGGLAFGGLYQLARDNLPNLPLPPMISLGGENAQREENWLMVAAILFFLFAVAHLVLNAAWGFLKLVAGRAIRQRGA